MTLEEQFNEAQERVQKLEKRPGTTDLLELYALYKQGTSGDVTGKRPGMIDFKARAKWDAWNNKKGLSQQEAQQKYVDLVESLIAKEA